METYARYAVVEEDGQKRFEPIEIQKHEPHPEKKGYLIHTGNISIKEVYKQLKERLEKEDLLPEEYFSISCDHHYKENATFPNDYKWIACYAVTGSSEGYYTHIDVLVPREVPGQIGMILESRLLYLGKTFQGFDFAARVAAACSKHLGA